MYSFVCPHTSLRTSQWELLSQLVSDLVIILFLLQFGNSWSYRTSQWHGNACMWESMTQTMKTCRWLPKGIGQIFNIACMLNVLQTKTMNRNRAVQDFPLVPDSIKQDLAVRMLLRMLSSCHCIGVFDQFDSLMLIQDRIMTHLVTQLLCLLASSSLLSQLKHFPSSCPSKF